jgi:hypothetical protein
VCEIFFIQEGTLMQASLSEIETRSIGLADKQGIRVMRDGRPAAEIVRTKSDKVMAAYALFGILPSNADLDSAREERLKL